MSSRQSYPHVAGCVPVAAQVVDILRQHPEYELEARFGTIVQQKFVPGVSRSLMDDIIDKMQKSSFVRGDSEWKEEQDVYYEHNGRYMRTRVQYDSNTMTVTSSTTEKVPVVPPVDCLHRVGDEMGGLDVRLSLKTEHIVESPPLWVNPTLVRIKQRRRFVTENELWAFDFSMTWSGRSKSEAEASQMKDDAVFEIECELIDVPRAMAQRSNEYLALSILLKMTDFMPSNSSLSVVGAATPLR